MENNLNQATLIARNQALEKICKDYMQAAWAHSGYPMSPEKVKEQLEKLIDNHIQLNPAA